MTEKKGSLLTYRPDIKVVDATIRDGGLVNDFRFTEEFIKDLYAANVAAGVDYMEFGYKASKDIFKPEDFGPWKFCEEDDIENKDYGLYNFKKGYCYNGFIDIIPDITFNFGGNKND